MTTKRVRTALSLGAAGALVAAAVVVAQTPTSQHVTSAARHVLVHSDAPKAPVKTTARWRFDHPESAPAGYSRSH